MTNDNFIIDKNGRHCTGCKEYKPWIEFSKRKDTRTGYTPKCKLCLQKDQNDRRRKQSTRDEAKSSRSCIDFDLANKFILGGFSHINNRNNHERNIHHH